MLGGLFAVSLVGTVVELIKEGLEPTAPAPKPTKTYPEPHRDEYGRVLIENCLLFESDKKNYGVVKAYEWAEQGKYNLEGEALKAEERRIEESLKWIYE